jgi:hypothetical protein
MMAAPPCNQNHESADDSKGEPFKHFDEYLVSMSANWTNSSRGELGRSPFVTSETGAWLQECIVFALELVWFRGLRIPENKVQSTPVSAL